MTGKKNFVKAIVFSLLTGTLFLHQSLFAQAIDPSMLEAFKKQAGMSQGNVAVPSPLDQARQQQFDEQQQALVEQRTRQRAQLSRLEKDFQARLNSKITQYGYSLFDQVPSGNGALTGTISDGYKLGIGDEIIVTLQGSKSQSYTVKVDIEGRVIIPDLKPITVSGMTYGSFRAILKKQVEESIIGTEVYVSLASVRMISVFVVGEVGMPGVVRTTSMASPLEILMHAGGVKKTGSLRNISIYRAGVKSTFDIYALLAGKISGFETLNDGDRIVVPTIGATIALDGEVVRPGIYELPARQDSISYQDAMKLSGGTLRPSGYELSRISIDDKGRQFFRKLSGAGKIFSGEAVIAHLVENSQSGQVELLGHVKTPGFRSLASAGSIPHLLGGLLNLKDDPYLLFGLIERVDERTQTRLLQPFNPEKILTGKKDLPLKNRDRIIFLGRSDVSFLISDEVRRVIFSGKYSVKPDLEDGRGNPKFCPPLKKLARIINDTQSERFATATRAVFVRKEAEDVKQEVADDEKIQALKSTALESRNGERIAMAEKLKQEQEEEETEESQSRCPAIYKEVKNLLPFILEYIVSVDGAIRLPGVYPVTKGTPVSSLIAVSGGTSNDANLTNIEVASFDQNAVTGTINMNWSYVDANQTDLASVSISPGGGIRIGSVFSNFEAGAVLLSGEFKQPGVYTIKKGERLSDLILRAGGLSDQAYSYGAIFTRKRVKEIQRAELQKTAKHLQSAMIAASVKKNIEADSLMAAQQLTNQLANAELLGRVVIEADPLKLSLDPSLDTVLEAGDALYVPKRPNFVVAMGDVLNPGALQFIPGKGVAEYIDEVGSYTRSADTSRVYIVYPNGVAKPISLSSWGGDRDLSIPPGTAIVIPTDLSPYDTLSLVKEVGDIFRNLAVSAASIAVLLRN